MQKILHKRRFLTFLIISSVIYGRAMYLLFIEFNILQSILYILLFFVSFHFLYIDLYKQSTKYLTRTMVILTIIEILFLGHGNLEICGGIIIIN